MRFGRFLRRKIAKFSWRSDTSISIDGHRRFAWSSVPGADDARRRVIPTAPVTDVPDSLRADDASRRVVFATPADWRLRFASATSDSRRRLAKSASSGRGNPMDSKQSRQSS